MEKGLCYNCDEKFHNNHLWKSKFLLMVQSEDDEEGEFLDATNDAIQEESHAEDTQGIEISYQVMAGISTPITFWLERSVKNQILSILIDSGSTHNFL